MRLLVHNLLSCASRTCNGAFPLRFADVEKLEIREADFNEEFLRGFLPKLEYSALVSAAKELGDESLPEMQPQLPANGEELSEEHLETLKALHHVLLELHVQDGAMVCPKCNHSFAIKDGIPNMLLAEHEVKR